MTLVTCRLTAKYRDQLRKPTLANRVRPTFTFLISLTGILLVFGAVGDVSEPRQTVVGDLDDPATV